MLCFKKYHNCCDSALRFLHVKKYTKNLKKMKVAHVFLDLQKVLATLYQLAESTASISSIWPHSEELISPATFVCTGEKQGKLASG